jgi:lipopolysaccharide export system protein LptC
MAVREFLDKLRRHSGLGVAMKARDARPTLSDPRALFNRKRDRLMWLKITLPLLAIGIIGYLTYRSYYSQSDTRVTIEAVEDVPKLDTGMKVSGIAFDGRSKTSDRPFSVTAMSATETTGNKDIIQLEEPQAQIELSDVTWIAVTAERGVYNRKLDHVDLDGAVTVYHDNGMTFVTEKAAMDLSTNSASGTAPVTGSDEFKQISSSDGFEMLDDGATVLFKGRSQLKILPKEKGTGG